MYEATHILSTTSSQYAGRRGERDKSAWLAYNPIYQKEFESGEGAVFARHMYMCQTFKFTIKPNNNNQLNVWSNKLKCSL